MKVFISWSGTRSRVVATALRDLLPDAVQSVTAWMSEHEIAPGARWTTELGSALEECRFGIMCLTPENLRAPWLLFEAGSLAKSIATARVVPYLFDLQMTDVEFPLAQFQGVSADRDGTLRLLRAINGANDAPLSADRIERVFERWWPDLDARLTNVPPVESGQQVIRADRELLEEILTIVRQTRAEAELRWSEGASTSLSPEAEAEVRVRLQDALNHPDLPWRSIRRLASAAAVADDVALRLLREDRSVRLSQNRNGEIIAGLISRVDSR